MAELSPVARALLETIAGPESAGDYNVMYGGGQFDSFDDHPRQPVLITSGPNKGKYSSAAGKYQFLGSTWDDIAGRYDIPDFSPANQDQAAWALATEEYKRDTGRDLEADLAAGDLSRVAPSLKNQWTSMPGGIEQGIGGTAFANAYAGNLGQPVNPAVGAINSATGQPAPKPNLLQTAFQGISNAAAPIMRGAQTAGQNAMPSIMKAALGSVAARTALIDPAIKNIMTGNRSGALGTPPPATGMGSKGYSTIMAPGGAKKLDNANGVWMGAPVMYGSNGFSGSGSSGGAHGGADNDKHRGEEAQPINGRRY
jgi:muramidase (phage lysozyme)